MAESGICRERGCISPTRISTYSRWRKPTAGRNLWACGNWVRFRPLDERYPACIGIGGLPRNPLTPARKSTIAIQFCHRRKSARPDGHIFRVYGDSHEAFSNSYMELGRKANIFGDDVRGGEEMRRIKNWLDSPASGCWESFSPLDVRRCCRLELSARRRS